MANVRLLVFAAGAVAAWFIVDAGAAAVGLLALPVAAFAATVVVHGSHRRARQRAEQAGAYYEAGLARLDYAFAGKGRAEAPFPVERHRAGSTSTCAAPARAPDRRRWPAGSSRRRNPRRCAPGRRRWRSCATGSSCARSWR